MTIEHLDLLGIETWKQSVLLNLPGHLVALLVVVATHQHLITLYAQVVVLLHPERAAERRLQQWRLEELICTQGRVALTQLEGEGVAIGKVDAGVAIHIYFIILIHSQFILCSLYPS